MSLVNRLGLSRASQGIADTGAAAAASVSNRGRSLSLLSSTSSSSAAKTDNAQKVAIKDVQKQLPPGTTKFDTNEKKIEYLNTYINRAQQDQLKSESKSSALSPLVEQAKNDLEAVKQVMAQENKSDPAEELKREALKQAGLSDAEIDEMIEADKAEMSKTERPDTKTVLPTHSKETNPMPEIKERERSEPTLDDWQKKAKSESEKIDSQALYDGIIGSSDVSQEARNNVVNAFEKGLGGASKNADIQALLDKVKDGTATQKEIKELKDDIICARNIYNASVSSSKL